MKKFFYSITWLIVFSFQILFLGEVLAQAPEISPDYTLVSKKRINRTITEFTFKASLVNHDVAIKNVSAVVTSNSPYTVIIDDGQLNFNDMAANETVVSSNTVIVRQDRTHPFNPEDVGWVVGYEEDNSVANVHVNLLKLTEGRQTVVGKAQELIIAIEFSTSEKDQPYTVKISQSISSKTGLTVTPSLDGTEFSYSKTLRDDHKQIVRTTLPGVYKITTTATIIETGETSTHIATYKILPVDAPNIEVPTPSVQLEGASNYLEALKPDSIMRVVVGVGRVFGEDYNKVTGMTVIEPDRGLEIILNDKGLGSDDEVGDRTYGSHVFELDTKGMLSGECMHFYTIVHTTKGDVKSSYSEDKCISGLIFDKSYIEEEQYIVKSGNLRYSRKTISVGFVKGTLDSRILEIVDSINGVIVDSNLSSFSFTVKLNDPPSVENALDVLSEITDQLETFPEVTSAGFTIFADLFSSYTNDPLYHSADIPYETGDIHAISQAGVDEAWHVIRGEDPIAILDTGIDVNHEDLKNKIIFKKSYNTADNNKVITDFNHHGSHVAGIAAAQSNNELGIAGVSWDSKIIPIKIYSAKSVKNLSGKMMVDAIDHTTTIKNLTIINFSSGFEIPEFSILCRRHVNIRAIKGLPLFLPVCIEEEKEIQKSMRAKEKICKAVDKAIKAKKIFIAAAGNFNSSKKVYPAACPGVISVAATEPSDIFNFTSLPVRWFANPINGSQYGNWVSLAAPGSQVLSTVPKETCNFIDNLFFPCLENTEFGYQYISGTSQASPLVAGAAAVILAKHPEYDRQQIKDRLEKSAFSMPGEGLGAGQIDLFEAVFNGNFELVKEETNQPEEWEKYNMATTACESKQEVLGLHPIDTENNKRMLVCDNSSVYSSGSMNTLDIPEGVTELPISFDWRVVSEELNETGLPGKLIEYCSWKYLYPSYRYICENKFMPRNDYLIMQLIHVETNERTMIFRGSLADLDNNTLSRIGSNNWLGNDWQHVSKTIPITAGAGKYTLRIQLYHSGYDSFDPSASTSEEGRTLFMLDKFRLKEI